ncbi:hypothetical protein BDY19DRAFT_901744 [Irpex rosettiformis]|uniref:Uncharacterized protein n=1 Tax=Irpex rosettiformis TaxID=378272 RepID=A0ACB8UKE9_9APHY|nr:hypothetical protein BDY19DRAFT_901744 [Irpex rosettiformis]
MLRRRGLLPVPDVEANKAYFLFDLTQECKAPLPCTAMLTLGRNSGTTWHCGDLSHARLAWCYGMFSTRRTCESRLDTSSLFPLQEVVSSKPLRRWGRMFRYKRTKSNHAGTKSNPSSICIYRIRRALYNYFNMNRLLGSNLQLTIFTISTVRNLGISSWRTSDSRPVITIRVRAGIPGQKDELKKLKVLVSMVQDQVNKGRMGDEFEAEGLGAVPMQVKNWRVQFCCKPNRSVPLVQQLYKGVLKRLPLEERWATASIRSGRIIVCSTTITLRGFVSMIQCQYMGIGKVVFGSNYWWMKPTINFAQASSLFPGSAILQTVTSVHVSPEVPVFRGPGQSSPI